MEMKHKKQAGKISEELVEWIGKCPTAFQAVSQLEKDFSEFGAEKLKETEGWNLEKGKLYTVARNGSALIAFLVPQENADHYQIMACHADSPSFVIKADPERNTCGYVTLNAEGYGGMIDSSWFDRPLGIAGRLLVDRKDGTESVSYDSNRDLCMIPNLAIHMNRQTNSGYAYNAQKDMQPILGMDTEKKLYEVIAEGQDFKAEDILGSDLFLYNRQQGCFWGADGEFVSSPRLDDLQCVFAGMKAMGEAYKKCRKEKEGENHAVMVLCVYDNEEVGSQTKQGAGSTFLKDVLSRIGACLGKTEEEKNRMLASSFMISADNAHSVHPNYIEKADPTNQPVMNKGIVIKYNSSQRYTTDAFSGAVMKKLCEKAKVPYQTFYNRSDLPGGSTLGNISTSQVALNSVDIGLAELAMHSSFETAGILDTMYLIDLLSFYYSSECIINDEKFSIK